MIEPSTSTEYAANVVLPPKKDETGKVDDRRMCGDFRNLNAASTTDPYSRPVRVRAQDATDANGLDAAGRAEVDKILSSVRARQCRPTAQRSPLHHRHGHSASTIART